MKKLMIAAAAAAMIGGAYAIESANIVGYQLVTVVKGYSTFTPVFKNVSGGSFDLMDILALNSSGAEFGKRDCNAKIAIQKLGTDGAYGETYTWQSNKTPVGWYLGGATAVVTGDVVFAQGEGFAVNCTLDAGANFRVSGEVDLVCRNTVVPGYSILGNSTPVEIDLTDVVALDADGNEFAKRACNAKIAIQKLGTDGAYGATYTWQSNKTPVGWYLGGATAVSKGDVTLKAGEAFCINNTLSPTANAILALPSPVTAE